MRRARLFPLLTCLLMLGFLRPARGSEPLAVPGITEAVCDVTLSASVPGIVSARKFKEGDFVKESETILELDKQLEQLEADRRELVVNNRKSEWEALETLVKKGSISVKKEDLEKAQTEYKIAVVERDMAVEQLRKRSITAPCSGFIAEITRNVGEACQAYQPLIHMVDTRQCRFVSNVEARAAARLKADQTIRLEFDTGSGLASVQGKIILLSPVVDPASGLQKVKVLFDNADGRIRPGISGRMFLD